MSRSHIRKKMPAPRRTDWASFIVGPVVVVLVLWMAIGRVLPHLPSGRRDTAAGKILETRIAIYSTHESQSGSYAMYRIEAHVTFDVSGESQDRWIPASEVDSSRDILAMRLSKPPATCLVSWPPRDPENARCMLK